MTMNYAECKEVIRAAIDDLQVPEPSLGKFLAVGKLRAVLEEWPAGHELDRLMKFEHDARAVLMGCYGIEEATWKNADGSPVLLRILDDANVMKLLSGKSR